MTERDWKHLFCGYVIGVAVAVVLWCIVGCTPHQSHRFWDGFGPVENGWHTTTQRSE